MVRGPASATHGAGAVAGVIGLETYTGLTFQGFDVTARQGVVEQFTGGELRYGKKLSDKTGIFAYYGAADQPGADSDSASYYIGRSYPAANGLPANVAGQPSSIALNDYWASGFDSPRQKAHASFVSGPFEIWGRFVQDGHQDRPLREIYNTAKPATLSVEDWIRGRQFRNRQTTVAGTFKKDISSTLRLNIMESFDRWSLKDQRMGPRPTLRCPAREGRASSSAGPSPPGRPTRPTRSPSEPSTPTSRSTTPTTPTPWTERPSSTTGTGRRIRSRFLLSTRPR